MRTVEWLIGAACLLACMGQDFGSSALDGSGPPDALGGSTSALGGVSSGGCPALPGTPSIHYAARLETAYSNNDPVTSVTDQGSVGVNLDTTASAATRPTFKSPCESGQHADLPCYSFDGGDFIRASAVSSSHKFLHDGTGMTCLYLAEMNGVGQQLVFTTGDSGGGAPGYSSYHFNRAENAIVQNDSSSSFLSSGATTWSENVVHVFGGAYESGTNGHKMYTVDTLAAAVASGTLTPSSNNPISPLKMGGSWGTSDTCTSGSCLNGEIYDLVCWDSVLSDGDRAAALASLECVYGGSFPQ